MISQELLQIIAEIDKNLPERNFSKKLTNLEIMLTKCLKFSEEVWEFQKEIYRKFYKQKKFSQENLEEEFADVMLTLLLLAKELDIDANLSLKNKLKIIKKRWLI